MKAIILSAGFGTRLRPYTHSGPKQMLPIVNKPIIEHLIDNLRQSNVKDIILVVGHRKKYIESYFGDGSKFGVNIEYVLQEKRLGIAHAIKLCKDKIDKYPLIVLLGDNLFRDSISDLIKKHKEAKSEASVGVTKVERPERFGIVELEDTKIKKIIEKPKHPPTNYAATGIYIFSHSDIFGIIDQLKKSKRGEYEITDAIQYIIDSGKFVEAIKLEKGWKDTGYPKDLLAANTMLLEDIKDQRLGNIENSKIDGKANISKTATVDNSTIIGPTIVGDRCQIQNSVVGPYVSIADDVSIFDSEIEYSIVSDQSMIKSPRKLVRSIVGKYSKIIIDKDNHMTYIVGDHSKIGCDEKF